MERCPVEQLRAKVKSLFTQPLSCLASWCPTHRIIPGPHGCLHWGLPLGPDFHCCQFQVQTPLLSLVVGPSPDPWQPPLRGHFKSLLGFALDLLTHIQLPTWHPPSICPNVMPPMASPTQLTAGLFLQLLQSKPLTPPPTCPFLHIPCSVCQVSMMGSSFQIEF